MSRSLALGVVALVALTACDGAGGRVASAATASGQTAVAAGQQDKIDQAMSAAPVEVARNATIMDWPETPSGQMRQLRAGNNGWTCMPSTPRAVGASGSDPMCLDRSAQTWVNAWSSRKTPRLKGVGLAYMLQGDAGVSNSDPFASDSTASNQWIRTGPHVMVIVPDVADLSGLSGDPSSGGPYVMWRGTPYAHIMMPVGAMPAGTSPGGTPPR